ncbi:MAG: protein-glutamate methylesterase/protein-glutamine glutaminase [Myxococcota bacterium]
MADPSADPIRVLVVDDAVVVRRLVTRVLESEPDVEVVGTARNGLVALARIGRLRPDVVTLDIEMPIMDGLEALPEIRRRYRDLPVVMFSTLSRRGAAATLEALSLGADDYVTKPTNAGGVQAALAVARDQLVPRIRALVKARRTSSRARPSKPIAPPPRLRPPGRVDAVVLGISTGGPTALKALFETFRRPLPVPVLVVQHMPPVFTRILAERLDGAGALRVREGEDGHPVSPGEAWIAPGDRHMEVRRRGDRVVLGLTSSPPRNSCRPSADVLFESAARVYGDHTLGVVMTGMGRDGRHGAEVVRLAGGAVLAQDEASSTIWGMPGVVVGDGLADAVLPLSELPYEILGRVARDRQAARPAAAPADGESA